jgi:hypothetical protein
MKPLITGLLAIWFVAVLWLGHAGLFAKPPGLPPFPILLGAAGPVFVFLTAYWLSAAFRAVVLSIDLRLATAIQAWRAGGLAFIALYVHGVLPGSFAWPAGLGDIAIGVTAPWIMLKLLREQSFQRSALFIAWNLLGILDLVVAVSMGGLSSALATGAPGEVTTAPMAFLPLVLIPAYLVPLFLMLHFAALFQSATRDGNNIDRLR